MVLDKTLSTYFFFSIKSHKFYLHISLFPYSVFGRVDFRGKKKGRENEEGKLFRGCLVGRGREKKDDETQVFSPRTHQKVFPLKWRENQAENRTSYLNKNVLQRCSLLLLLLLLLFYFYFWSFSSLFSITVQSLFVRF